jgi:hypothetical protein
MKAGKMSNLSDDEFAVLMIAQQGAPMMPIDRWKPAVERLVKLKYLRPQPSPQDPTGVFNCVITPEGRAACEKRDQEDTDAFRNAITAINKTPEDTSPKAIAANQIKRCPHCGGVLDA